MNQYAGWFGASQYNSTLYFQRPLGMGDGTAPFLGWNIALQGEPPWLSTFLKDTSAERQKVLRGFWELSSNMRSKLSRLKLVHIGWDWSLQSYYKGNATLSTHPKYQLACLANSWGLSHLLVQASNFDTCAIDSVDEEDEHLCSTIRGILSRLHHLCLRLNHICPNLFDPNYQFPDPGRSVMTKFMAPHLKSMTINLRPLLWYGPMLREHRVHTQTVLPYYSTYRSVETDEIKNLAHRDLMVKSLVVANKKKTLPSIQQLQIVNTTGRLKHDYTCDGNESMVLPSILSQTQPHASPYRCYISAVGELFDQALSTPSTLIQKTTHSFSGNCLRWSRKSRETWIVNQNKSRFPDSFGNSSVAKQTIWRGLSGCL